MADSGDTVTENTSQPVRAYLQQRQNEVLEYRREFETALGCLPEETPVYQYQSVTRLKSAVHTLDADGGYCVFVNVPMRAVDEELEEQKIGRITYYRFLRILVVKMPGECHEAATSWLDTAIAMKVTAMGMQLHKELYFMRSTRRHHKEPNSSYRPMTLPAGRLPLWPSVVVETGRSEAHAALFHDAQQWFQKSSGLIQNVITVKVARQCITITRYIPREQTENGCQPEPVQTVIVQTARESPAHITGGPFIIPFRELFLRDPIQDQGNLVFTNDEMRSWAEWALMAHGI
ncbi:hypothetical protein PRK78_001369 [Emydomyces testavorans]|uniref:Uncharacterized protein n=1 Tax=Emydomyces testavorans TaxID=2070801 RepID=A0AAF0IIL1_9EURO|nr:hypothetical protein PRK78_001369 [Emydomyces testavorans]